MNPAITCVSLEMTTACDRACPECCCNIPHRPAVHHPWEYFEAAAKVIYGVERVHLSGGECTYHPQFAEFVPKFKELFGCKRLSMVTDGWGVTKHDVTLARHVNQIHFTRYGNKPAAEATLRYLESAFGIELLIFDAGPKMANFTPRSAIGGGKPCFRAWWLSGQVAYADGKLWGCCVAPGIEGAKGVVFANFSAMEETEEFLRVAIPNPPCERCWFSE